MGVGEARAHHDMVLRLCLYIGACRCAVILVRVQDASSRGDGCTAPGVCACSGPAPLHELAVMTSRAKVHVLFMYDLEVCNAGVRLGACAAAARDPVDDASALSCGVTAVHRVLQWLAHVLEACVCSVTISECGEVARFIALRSQHWGI
jgi:hypothetical protein